MSAYERNSYGSFIQADEYVTLWSMTYSDMMFKYCTSMPIKFALYASYDLFAWIGLAHEIIQNMITFPHMQLKNIYTIEKNIIEASKNMKTQINSLQAKFDDELWPTLAKHEQGLKEFELYGIILNGIEFCNEESNIDLTGFGDVESCVGLMRTDILSSLYNDSDEVNQLFCCDKEWDFTQNYIKCVSNHPLCKKQIHEKCSGLKKKKKIGRA
eukprot:517505_1